MPHVVFCTFGSLGDIYPYISIARGLQARGLRTSLATSVDHKAVVESNGVNHIHVRPDVSDLCDSQSELLQKVMNRVDGPRFVLRDVIMKHLRLSYQTLEHQCADVDLLVTHPLTMSGILVARKRNIPYASSVLAPVNLFSSHDPGAFPTAEWVPDFRTQFGPSATRLLLKLMLSQIYSWTAPYRQLQSELGLQVDKRNPFAEGQFSPIKNLALFSPIFGPPQVDWPPNTIATGFPFLDDSFVAIPPEIERFLDSGEPPVVFTLGSSAVWDAGTFFAHSIEALRKQGLRGILITGPSMSDGLRAMLDDRIIAADYLPHSLIFPRAAAIVHQCGVGTTARALSSGKPQLLMPYSHDQFDNARRVVMLGCGMKIDRNRYTADSVARLIAQLLSITSTYSSSAAKAARRINEEDGAELAAKELMKLMN